MSAQQKIVLAVAAVGALAAGPALATTTIYDWSYSDSWDSGVDSGSGTFTVTNGFITNATGSLDGLTVTGIVANGINAIGDNAFPLDASGVNFSFSGTGNAGLLNGVVGGSPLSISPIDYYGNIWVDGGYVYLDDAQRNDSHLQSPATDLVITAAPVPEPVSASLLAAGVLGVVVARRRRGKTSPVQA